jgi:hypothetical protein
MQPAHRADLSQSKLFAGMTELQKSANLHLHYSSLIPARSVFRNSLPRRCTAAQADADCSADQT